MSVTSGTLAKQSLPEQSLPEQSLTVTLTVFVPEVTDIPEMTVLEVAGQHQMLTTNTKYFVF